MGLGNLEREMEIIRKINDQQPIKSSYGNDLVLMQKKLSK